MSELEALDKIGILAEFARHFQAVGLHPKTINGTVCLDRPRRSSGVMLSAVAVLTDRFRIVCVEERDSAGKITRYTVQLLGPAKDEIDNEHLSPREGFHRHPCADGEKQQEHVPTTGSIGAAVSRFVGKMAAYRPRV